MDFLLSVSDIFMASDLEITVRTVDGDTGTGETNRAIAAPSHLWKPVSTPHSFVIEWFFRGIPHRAPHDKNLDRGSI
jgi:hypothetical protein